MRKMEQSHEEVRVMRRLQEATLRGNVASLLQLLDEHPLLLDRITVDYCNTETPLHVAAMRGHVNFAKEILNRNKELGLELDSKGCSPLHMASAKGNVEMVKLFLSELEPARICKLRDELGRTPLHVAAMKGQDEVLKELLHHADPESAWVLTHHGETILHLAVKHNNINTLKLLLTDLDFVNQFLNVKDINGNTILHVAVAHKQIETVKYLVGGEIGGVDINEKNNHGYTALDVLLQSRSDWRDVEIAELLRAENAVSGSKDTTNISLTERGSNQMVYNNNNWMSNMQNGLMMAASLIGTVAFQSALAPAGGLWQQDGENPRQGKYFAGESIMDFYCPGYYNVYYKANTISFICSNSIILLLMYTPRHLGTRRFMIFLMSIMCIAILSPTTTYTVASLVVAHTDTFPTATSIVKYIIAIASTFAVVATIILLVNIWCIRKHIPSAKSTTAGVDI